MEQRMQEFSLSGEQVLRLLEEEPVAHLATLCEDGAPYVTPVYFVMRKGAFYFHGLPRGQKLQNIMRQGRVSIAVTRHIAIMDDVDMPCKADAAYESAVIKGTARLVEDEREKRAALDAIVAKYTPQLAGFALPRQRVQGTAVVRVEIEELTGKYHR